MQNCYVYSPNQLAVGQNLALIETVPAIEGKTSSEIIPNYFYAMHAACKSFIDLEASEKWRRMIKSKRQTLASIVYEAGATAYFKRADSDLWKGPSTVI